MIDYIPGGHTAGLAVVGEGLGVLADLLRELPPGDLLTLTAAVNPDAEPGPVADGAGGSIPCGSSASVPAGG